MDIAKQIRLEIVDILSKVDNVNLLKSVRQQLELLAQNVSSQQASQNSEPAFMNGVQPIRQNVSLEQMMKEQHYQPVTYEQFRQIADEIAWQESLDELLEAVNT